MRTLLAVIIISVTEDINSQSLFIWELNNKQPIANALIIQNNNLLGSTDEYGYCNLKNLNEKSKVCIKAFGFLDTCLLIGKHDSIVFLNAISFEWREVEIAEKALSPYQQLMKFLNYSLSLCNQHNELRTYEYDVTVVPDNLDAYDKMEGTFVYEERSSKKRRASPTLYQCHAHRKVTRNLFEDSVTQSKLEGSTQLPLVIWYLDDMNKPSVQNIGKWLKDKPIYKEYNDTTGYFFAYIDTSQETSHVIWRFGQDGRLREVERIELFEKSKFELGKKRGNFYTHLRYTESGTLMVENGVKIRMASKTALLGYSTHTTIKVSDTENCETNLKIPISINPRAWAKINDIPTIVVDSD